MRLPSSRIVSVRTMKLKSVCQFRMLTGGKAKAWSLTTLSKYPTQETSTPPSTSSLESKTFTATESAFFSCRGASMAAFSPDDNFKLPVLPEAINRNHTTLRKDEATSYTGIEAETFLRRGACMVAWPSEEEQPAAKPNTRQTSGLGSYQQKTTSSTTLPREVRK